jgi:hypothetical protein
MFLFETRNGPETLLGSANATMRGFERNCEAIVSLLPGIPIDKFCSNFLFKEKKQLNGFVREYTLDDWMAVDRKQKEEEEKEHKIVEEVRTALCLLDLEQRYDRTSRRLSLHAVGGIPIELTSRQVVVTVCPLGMVERYPESFPALDDVFMGQGLVFADCPIKDLTEFVHYRIRRVDTGHGPEFIVKTKTDFSELMDTRDSDLRRSILSRSEGFLYLILFGRARIREPGSGESSKGGFGSGGGVAHILGNTVMIEDVMRACTEDPGRVDEVNQFLRDLKGDGVDPEFINFWKAFTAALDQTRTKESAWR